MEKQRRRNIRRRRKERGNCGLHLPARPAHGRPGDYNSQHAPRATPPLPGTGGPSQGHGAPSAPAPSTPGHPHHSTAGHLHSWSLFVPQQGLSSPAPRCTPELGVCSSVFNEIVAKSPKRRLGGSGSSVFTHRGCEGTGEAAGEPLSPGVSRCACLTVLIYSNSRNVIYSFLCGPIRQISTYL